MHTARLHSIVRSVLVSEVREFASTTIEAEDGTEMIGSELVREIRNALWMPQGIAAHARILLAASNIEPQGGTLGKGQPGWGGSARIDHAARLQEELELLDMHMEDFIREHFGLVLGEVGPIAVKLRVPKGEGLRKRDKAVAYDMFRLALQNSMRTSVDTAASRAAHKGGRYDPTRRPGFNAPELEHDLVDAVIQDFMEILLQPEVGGGVELDKAASRMDDIVKRVMGRTTRESFSAGMRDALEGEKRSALAKLLRAEKERGASVPDAAAHELVRKVGEVMDLFYAHIVGGREQTPVGEYGEAFAAIVAKACGIDSDYQLPSALRVKPIRPLLPERVDEGIVDFVDAVHEEVERQVRSLPTLKSVQHNILSPDQDLYDRSGNPTTPYTYDDPHPAYDS